MLANIASYWFVSLPGVLTGLLLLRLLIKTRKSMESRKQVRASVGKR